VQRAFRVWVVGYRDWQPTDCLDVPPAAKVLELAEAGCLSEVDARRYLKSFNKTMLDQQSGLWAMAVAVSIRYEGDLLQGTTVEGQVSPFA
jgi:hypothetical protein